MRKIALTFLKDERGATGIEYAVIAAVVAAVTVPALGIVGGSLSEAFAEISATLSPHPEIRCNNC